MTTRVVRVQAVVFIRVESRPPTDYTPLPVKEIKGKIQWWPTPVPTASQSSEITRRPSDGVISWLSGAPGERARGSVAGQIS